MSVNQKIKEALNRGDIKRIAEILKVHPSTLSEKLNADKEIDSVDFINAVCQVTKKPFSYFKPVITDANKAPMVEEESSPLYITQLNNMPEERQDATRMAADLAVRHWKEKYEQAKKQVDILEKALEDSRNLAELRGSLNDDLKKQIEELKKKADARK